MDSRRDLAESANEILEWYGGTPMSEEAIGRMVGDGAATLVARVFAAAHVPQPADALTRFLALYNSRLLRFTRPYSGIPEALAGLKPRVMLAVLTNKPLVPTRYILEGLDLSRYFDDRVIGGDGPFPRKPEPAGLRHLIDSAGVMSSNTMLVGDSVIDWRTARGAGAISCVARYGFGYEGFPTELIEPTDCVVDDPGQIPALL